VLDAGGDGTLRAGDRMPDLTLTPNSIRSTAHPTLLSGWHAAGHLALVLQGDDLRAPFTRLPQIETLTLTLADLDGDAKRLLGRQSKLILIRPDGYVGFRGRAEESAQLASYVRRVALA
jgi:hypothetical protein